jgi:hypothetical protein
MKRRILQKGSAGILPAVSRILRGTSSEEEVEPRMDAKEREWGKSSNFEF